MITSIHQPEFMSWIGFWNKMYLSDVMILYDTAQFNHSNYHHRCKLETVVSENWFSIPYNKKDKFKVISNVRIRELYWKERFFNILKEYYRKHPFYNETINLLYDCLKDREFEYLSDLNIHMILFFKKKFNIETLLLKSSDLTKPPLVSTSTGKIVDMLNKVLETKIYLAGDGSYKYMVKGKKEFDNSPYEIVFRKVNNNKTISSRVGRYGLSIIDTLMNNGLEKTKYLIRNVDVTFFDFEKNIRKLKED